MQGHIERVPVTITTPAIPMENEMVHSDERPFCGDPDCPCHCDESLVRREIITPLQEGLLTGVESVMRFYGRRI